MAGEPLLVFRCSAQKGYSAAVSVAPSHITARKLEQQVGVAFTDAACVVKTAEGSVHAQPGDAIVTGVVGELWRVSRARFEQKYIPVPPTVMGQSGSYLSLPNRVLALRLHRPFKVVLADDVSELTGRTGDWLVDYGDGSLGIVAARIFDRTYEIVP